MIRLECHFFAHLIFPLLFIWVFKLYLNSSTFQGSSHITHIFCLNTPNLLYLNALLKLFSFEKKFYLMIYTNEKNICFKFDTFCKHSYQYISHSKIQKIVPLFYLKLDNLMTPLNYSINIYRKCIWIRIFLSTFGSSFQLCRSNRSIMRLQATLICILCWGYPFNDGHSEVFPRSQGNNFLENMLNGSLNHIVTCTSNTLYTTYQGRIPSNMSPLIYKNIILFHL